MSSRLALLGGMFDPVHKGHVSAARFALQFLSVDRLSMIPCHLPNHKSVPSTSARHRLAMLKIATDAYPQIEIDSIELERDQVSYTVDTLKELGDEHSSMVFVMGVDAFNDLPQWHEWKMILELSHLLVLARPGSELAKETLAVLNFEQRRVESVQEMWANPHGKIIYCPEISYDVASTSIREKLAKGEDVTSELDESVIAYIYEHELYKNQKSK